MTWSTTATLPQRRHGPAWTTAATPSGREHGPGWFTLDGIEKVAPLAAAGNLSVTVQDTYPLARPALGGAGTLSAVVTPVRGLAAAFTAVGDLSARTQERRFVTAAFSATTDGINVAVDVYDGLTGVISGGDLVYADGLAATVNAAPGVGGAVAVAANFSAVGGWAPVVTGHERAQGWLTATVTSIIGGSASVTAPLAAAGSLSATGIGYEDAQGWLTATVIQSAASAAGFAGAGALSATVTQSAASTAVFGGTGSLTATTTAAGPPTAAADLAATGSLAAATIGYHDAQGWLTATVTQSGVITRMVNFDQAAEGMLTATLAKTLASVVLSGAGALSATVTPVSAPVPATAAFSGAGALTVSDIIPVASVPAALSGAGGLTAVGVGRFAVAATLSSDGALTATNSQKYTLTAALTGSGALSATVTQVPVPTITNITTSPFHVGDTITITGTAFTGTVSVTVGGVAATSVTVGSSTSLTCVVPSVALGAQNVVVTAASGPSSPYSITLVTSNVPLSIIGTPTVVSGAQAVTLPAHAVGDMIILVADRGINTVVGKPAAGGTVPTWTDIDAPVGTQGISLRTAYAVATATNHTSGTWTNAGSLAAIVLRGQSAAPIGAHATATAGVSSSGTLTAPAVTLTKTDGTSMIFHVFAQSTSIWGAAPAGYTRVVSNGTTGTTPALCVNSKNVSTSAPAATEDGAAFSAWCTATIEILD